MGRGAAEWVFDSADHDRVRSLCREIYGASEQENGKDGTASFPNAVRHGRNEFAENETAVPHYYGHRRRLRERMVAAGAESLPDYELLEMLLFAANPQRRREAGWQSRPVAFRRLWQSDERRSRRAVRSRARPCRHRRDQIGARGGPTADAPRITKNSRSSIPGASSSTIATPRSRTRRPRNSASCSSTARTC